MINNEDKIIMLCNSIKKKLKDANVIIEPNLMKFEYDIVINFNMANLHFRYTLTNETLYTRNLEQIKFDLFKSIQEDILDYFVEPWYTCGKEYQ